MPAAPELVRVRFAVDENLIALGRALMGLRRDVACFATSPLAELLPQGILDPEWIPVVAERGLGRHHQRRQLRTRPSEAALAVANGLKVVHLAKAGYLTAWDQTRRLVKHWDAVESHTSEYPDGPWWLELRSNQTVAMRYEPGLPARPR